MPYSEIEKELSIFRSRMLMERPFYGDILLRIPVIQDNSISTACTDGRVIRWNGPFFRSLTPPERHYVLMHEVFHVLLMHSFRTDGRNPELWNIATDLVVNQICDNLAADLSAAEDPYLTMKRPAGVLFRPLPPDETAENLYGRILMDSKGRSGPLLRSNYRMSAYSGEMVPVPGDPMRGDIIPSRLSDEEKAAMESSTRRMLKEAAERMQGNGASGYLPRALTKLMQTRPLNWKALLREHLTEVQSDDTSYTTPERKYLHMDLILPGHGLSEEGELESVWAFVDSSGSISDKEMSRFLTELYHIVREFRCEMNIAYWDTSVTDIYRKIRKEKDVLKAKPKHSGGTDINCVYQWVRQNRIRPFVSVILTDGYFGRPDPALIRALPVRDTILVISNDSQNPVYQQIGKVARLTDACSNE